MRRILHVELNANFYRKFWPAFFKSFCSYNSGWELFVVDLGLTDEQRTQLERYGEVRPYRVDPLRRWIHLSARIESLCDLLQTDDIVMHLDTDMTIMTSFEEYVNELLQGDFELYGTGWDRACSVFARFPKRALEMLGVPGAPVFESTPRIHAGWLLMRHKVGLRQAFEWLRDNWTEYVACVTEEETGLAALLYARGVKVKVPEGLVDCPNLVNDLSFLLPTGMPTSVFGAEPSKMMHFSITKYWLFHTSAGSSREEYMAWCDTLMRPYEELPWPSPEEFRGSS